jgi:recombination protein RecA
MRLLPSILVTLRKYAIYKEGGEKRKNQEDPVIGNRIVATTIKNRGYPPFQDATVMIDYVDGVRPFAGVLDLAVEAEIIEKSGSWYSYKGERLGQGKLNSMKNLEEFPEILDDIDIWLESTGYSTYNKEAEEAEELIQTEQKIKEPKKIKGKKDDN